MGIEDIKKWENVEGLIIALKHKDRDIQEAATVALERMEWEPKSDIEKAWYLAAKRDFKELIKVGEPAVEPLIQAMKDHDRKIRLAAAVTLGEIGEPAVEPLIQAMKDESQRFWRMAKVFRDSETLTQSLADESRDIREAIAVALGGIKDSRAVELIIQALKHEDSFVRWGAAGALSNIGDARVVKPLIQALKDESGLVRESAAAALGKIPDLWEPKVIDDLFQATKDEDRYVREAAVYALGEFRKKSRGR